MGIPSSPILPGGLVDLLSGRELLVPRGQADRSPRNARGEMQKIKAAKDFESVLLHRLLGEMRRTIPESGLLSNGISKQLEDIFWMYLAQEMAERGGLGLWKELYKQFGQLEASATRAAGQASGRAKAAGAGQGAAE